MSDLWSLFVGSIQAGLFVLAHLYGGNVGLAIITLSFVVRLALLPLTLRIARRSQKQQMRLQEIQPELQRLKERYRNQPEKLSQKTMELYKAHGIRMLDGTGLLGSFVQLPVFAGLFSAIKQGVGNGGRFLWIADISQPDIFLALIIAALTFASSLLSPNPQPQARSLCYHPRHEYTHHARCRLPAAAYRPDDISTLRGRRPDPVGFSGHNGAILQFRHGEGRTLPAMPGSNPCRLLRR